MKEIKKKLRRITLLKELLKEFYPSYENKEGILEIRLVKNYNLETLLKNIKNYEELEYLVNNSDKSNFDLLKLIVDNVYYNSSLYMRNEFPTVDTVKVRQLMVKLFMEVFTNIANSLENTEVTGENIRDILEVKFDDKQSLGYNGGNWYLFSSVFKLCKDYFKNTDIHYILDYRVKKFNIFDIKLLSDNVIYFQYNFSPVFYDYIIAYHKRLMESNESFISFEYGDIVCKTIEEIAKETNCKADVVRNLAIDTLGLPIHNRHLFFEDRNIIYNDLIEALKRQINN